MNQEPQKSNTVLIVIAIIGVVGTIIATTIGVIGNYNIEKLRRDTELTRIALVSMATQGGATQASMASTISAPTDVLINIPTEIPIPTNTFLPPTVSFAPTPDCWQTIWTLNPANETDISLSLSSPRPGYVASFDSGIYADSPGSLRLETNKIVKDYIQDQNSWSWMINIQVIPANNGLYRVTAMMKTQDVYASHISVVARDKDGLDIFNGSNTNQIAVVPVVARALYETNDWQLYSSNEFNPKEWSNDVMYIAIGINAGWSIEGKPSVTWFDNVQVQYCSR